MMTLQEMTDAQFSAILSEVSEIQYLIIKVGGIATKSRVEDVLMTQHGLDRSDAHTFTNCAESRNIRDFYISDDRVIWACKSRPEPIASKYGL